MIPNRARFAKRRFRPHPLLTLAAVCVVALTARLSVWQFDRAEQKAALETAAADAMSAPPVALGGDDAGLRPYQHARATGVYLADAQIAIDNRVHNRIAGYHIITPLAMPGGSIVAVNRGFVARREPVPPPPAGEVTVQGILQKDNANAFTLSPDTIAGDVWQNLDLQKYAAVSGLPLISLVLQVTPPDSGEVVKVGGLYPASVRVDFRSAQSVGYAWQWLTFCALGVIFYLLLGFREPKSSQTPGNAEEKKS